MYRLSDGFIFTPVKIENLTQGKVMHSVCQPKLSRKLVLVVKMSPFVGIYFSSGAILWSHN